MIEKSDLSKKEVGRQDNNATSATERHEREIIGQNISNIKQDISKAVINIETEKKEAILDRTVIEQFNQSQESIEESQRFYIEKVSPNDDEKIRAATEILKACAKDLEERFMYHWYIYNEKAFEIIKQRTIKEEVYIVYKGRVPVSTLSLTKNEPDFYEHPKFNNLKKYTKEKSVFSFATGVHPNCQGHGIGKIIMNNFFQFAKESGFDYFRIDHDDYVEDNPRNGRLTDFYTNKNKLGFSELSSTKWKIGDSQKKRLQEKHEHNLANDIKEKVPYRPLPDEIIMYSLEKDLKNL